MANPRFAQYLLDELWIAYQDARRGKRHTVDEHRFELCDIESLHLLRDRILDRTYRPSRGVAFIVRDPVIREIVAAPFCDRVVHHLLFNICGDWWDRHFIVDSYSCRVNKGTLYAQQRLATHIRRVTKNYSEPAFCVKLDVQSYFMSMRHDLLYKRVLWGLERQFAHPENPKNHIICHPEDRDHLRQTLHFLWHQIIHDDPMRDIVIRGLRSDWKDLPYTKSLFNQPKGRGIVIGNLTSQLLSNILLDQLDRFVVHELGYHHYGRYVDDFFIIVPAAKRTQLLRDIDVIDHFLKENLDLTLHPKKRLCQSTDHGIPFVGAVIYPHFITLGARSRRKCFTAAYNLATNGTGDVDGIISRIGSVTHINSRHFFHKVFDSFGWEF